MSKERDEILSKLRALYDDFGSEFKRYSDILESRVRGCEFAGHSTVAWSSVCAKLDALIKELDPDANLPIEDPLEWHGDFLGWFEAAMESRCRKMHRRCFQCSQCKAGLEVEFPADKDKHRKRVRCSCGHVQLVVCFN